MSGTFFGAPASTEGDVVVVGVPFDHGSIYSSGCRSGAATLRALTAAESVHDGIYDFRTRKKIVSRLRVGDLGDFSYRASQLKSAYFDEVEACAEGLARQGSVLLGLGGDHSVTLPLATGVARGRGRLQILQLDAHHDHAELSEHSQPTHSNFIGFLARVPEIERIVQVGVRGYSSMVPARLAKVEERSLEDAVTALEPGVPTYVTIDTDAFDPSIAPAVVHPLPDGLRWRDLDLLLGQLIEKRCPIVGLDWTEYNPDLEARSHPTGIAISFALARAMSALERQKYGDR